MAKAYSVDLRSRVLDDYDRGMRPVDLARQYRVDRSWIYKLISQRRETGHIEPLKGERGPQPKLKTYYEQLQKIVVHCPDATLEELRQKLGIDVGISTLWRA